MVDFFRLFRLFTTTTAVLFVAVAFLFPLHLPPWPTFYNEFFFAAAILLFVSRSLKHTCCWPFPLYAIALALIGAVAGHALSGSGAPRENFWLIGLYVVIALLAYHVGTQQPDDRQKGLILGALAGAAILSALLAVLQWSGVFAKGDWDPAFFFPNPAGGRSQSNIGQANNLGTLLIIGLWSTLSLLHFASRVLRMPRLLNWFAGAAFALLVLGIYLSGSRTAILNLILAPIFVALWLRGRNESLRSPWLTWSLAPVVLYFFLQAVMPTLSDWLGLAQPLADRSLTKDDQRLRLWAMAWEAVLKSPWWGHGPLAMATAHLQLSPVFGAFDYRIVAHAHNTVLDLFLMFGIPLGAMVTVGVVWLWIQAWRKSSEPSHLFFWLICTAMLVHALLEYPLHYGFFLWLLFLMFGWLTGASGRLVTRPAPALLSILWLSVAGTIAYILWRGYVEVEKLYTLMRIQGPEAVQAALSQAHPYSRACYPGLLERLNWITRPTYSLQGLTLDELLALTRSAQSYPLPGLLWRATLAYAFIGDERQSAWYGERLCAMFDPNLCKAARHEWPLLGKEQPNWPELPWQQWDERPLPGRHP